MFQIIKKYTKYLLRFIFKILLCTIIFMLAIIIMLATTFINMIVIYITQYIAETSYRTGGLHNLIIKSGGDKIIDITVDYLNIIGS